MEATLYYLGYRVQGQGDAVSKLISLIAHIVTNLIINLLTKSP